MCTCCNNRIKDNNYQDFPTNNSNLNKNMDLDIKNILKINKNKKSIVCCYVITSIHKGIKTQEPFFLQKGSAPNFQGDFISLCTCKHKIRTEDIFINWDSSNNWKSDSEVWIAGFTSKETFGKQYLFYLMKINNTFKSQYNLYNYYKDLNNKIIEHKSSVNSRFGDLFIPKNKNLSEDEVYDYNNYKEPICKQNNYHVHYYYNIPDTINANDYQIGNNLLKKSYVLKKTKYHLKDDINNTDYEELYKYFNKKNKNYDHKFGWHYDILKYKNKPHALLIGDPKLSFLWTGNKIKFLFTLNTLKQGKNVFDINNLLDILKKE